MAQGSAPNNRETKILDAAVRVIATDGVRGLRIEKLAAEAGVSAALIYHYFGDRSGILRAALDAINANAQRYTDDEVSTAEPSNQISELLLLEMQRKDAVRQNSIAWGELRASAVFNEELRPPLKASTAAWNAQIAQLIRRAQEDSTVSAHVRADDAAERLTSLVEGLSERWHSGSLTLPRARALLSGAISIELGLPEPVDAKPAKS
ncbi:TetR family transcriptional regulator [Mycobacteroides chelonae]|uniref:TetR/AcrR family transcriptional regulator n=1 Tax=Mycobacteroides chelonae TaxID=1774 RepID=UPI0008A944BB|nr:TetR/AcrR family transcriptional regulator [Mycobacteroides chelonae]OHU23892.1 TetR family transcriptional regulator [Mycobacteroides chelonae]